MKMQQCDTYPGILLFWHRQKDYGVLVACDGATYKFQARRLRDIFKSTLHTGVLLSFSVNADPEEITINTVHPAGNLDPTDIQILEEQLQKVIWQRSITNFNFK
jgi:hypothetical protein